MIDMLTEIEWHGAHIWSSRPFGIPERRFVDLLPAEHREAVEAYLRRVRCTSQTPLLEEPVKCPARSFLGHKVMSKLIP